MKSDLPERTFAFAARVVRICLHLDESSEVSRTLANQLLRSGTSIEANVEEGQVAQSTAHEVRQHVDGVVKRSETARDKVEGSTRWVPSGQRDAHFISKYSIACKEARETHYWLRLLAETELLSTGLITPLQAECNEIIAILTSIIKKLRAEEIPKSNRKPK